MMSLKQHINAVKNFAHDRGPQNINMFLLYLVEIYYQQNLNIAQGLGDHPHNAWIISIFYNNIS